MVSGTQEAADKLRFPLGGSTHTPRASGFLLSSHRKASSSISTKLHVRVTTNEQMNRVLTHFNSENLLPKGKTGIYCWQRSWTSLEELHS